MRRASYNSGKAGGVGPSGSGISLGGVSGGVIENSQAYENGWLCDAPEGPVGIWTYDSTNVVIQYNSSFHNHTAKADGDGFDLDQNTSNSVLQYNTSYENDGTGYLLAHGLANTNHTDNSVRYNTSQNDGRKHAAGGITLYGRIRNATIRNNTVSMTPISGYNQSAIAVRNWSIRTNCVQNVLIIGNSFTAYSDSELVDVTPAQAACASGLSFQLNTYQGNPFVVQWGSATYSSVTAWHNATGQE